MKKLFYLATVLCCSATMLEAGSATVVQWRTLEAPTFEQKVYDGTNTAVVANAQFAISNKIAGKENVEVVVDEASFDTAAAGIGRVITVKVKLAGADAAEYVLEVDTLKAYNQVIYPKTLSVDSSKMVIEVVRNESDFPMDAKAVVVTPAEIDVNEVIIGDEVALATTAAFRNIEVGTGKTVYAHYALTGKDSANYQLDRLTDTYSVEGVISPAIDIKPYEDGAYFHFGEEDAALGLCPGGVSSATFQINSGAVSSFSITYSQAAKEAGFEDVKDAVIPAEGNIIITVPDNAPCGQYGATVTLTYEAEGGVIYHSGSIALSFCVRVAAEEIRAVFNDVAGLRDLDNRYVSYQWYRDGQAIDGATSWYYQQEGGLNGVYKVLIITTEGEEYFSCEVNFTPEANVAAEKSFDDNVQIVVITARTGVRYNVLGQIVK